MINIIPVIDHFSQSAVGAQDQSCFVIFEITALIGSGSDKFALDEFRSYSITGDYLGTQVLFREEGKDISEIFSQGPFSLGELTCRCLFVTKVVEAMIFGIPVHCLVIIGVDELIIVRWRILGTIREVIADPGRY